MNMVYLPIDSSKREGLTIHNHIQYQNPHKLHKTLKEFMRIIKTNQLSHTLHLLPKFIQHFNQLAENANTHTIFVQQTQHP